MFVSIYYEPSLFNAHTMIFIVHIFMNVNKLCLNQEKYNSSNSTQTDKTPTHEHLYSDQYYHINSIANSCTSVNNASTCAYIKVLRVTIYKLPPCGINNAGTGVTNTGIGTYNDVVNRCLEFVPYPAYPFYLSHPPWFYLHAPPYSCCSRFHVE